MRARTPLMDRVQRALRLAAHCERTGEPAREAVERLRSSPRRRMLAAAAGAGLALSLAPTRPLRAAPSASGLNVAIVGAGLAGLQAARVLEGKGARVTLFDADTARVGGRVWSLRGVFPGQVAERGGELIDTGHVTVRGLAREFGLTLESYRANQLPGEEFFYFSGRHWSEAEVVDEFRAFLPAIKRDLRRASPEPTAEAHTVVDRELDLTPLSAYLDSRGAGALIRAVLDTAYTIEFGREIDRQSALAMLFFIGATRSANFRPFGSSDERFHVVEGNDAVPRAIAATLAQPVRLGHRLLHVGLLAHGRVRVGFDTPGGARDSDHDAVIIAIPAPAVRQVVFAPSVPLGAGQLGAIRDLDYGTSSKLMVGFRGRPWFELSGSNGASSSDLPNHQVTWETNPSLARNGERGVLTDFSGGERGARLDPMRPSAQAQTFLTDLERIYPGSATLARRDNQGRVVAHLENWSKLPLYMGGYTNNQPGYFTTIEGLYAKPAGRVFFAGEHTDSFYGWQGFMEGALVSGARAADEVLRAA
jgi:monoamine oxidase